MSTATTQLRPDAPAGVGRPTAPVPARFEPVILVFTCNWCSYRAADLAGTARMKYPPNVRLVRLMCSGRVDPTFVLRAFADGADGVVLTGCWPTDCHYRLQNVKALRRFILQSRVLTDLGIEPARYQRVYASAAEGQQLAAAFERITEEVRALGPLDWGGRAAPPPRNGRARTAAAPVATAPGADLPGVSGPPGPDPSMPAIAKPAITEPASPPAPQPVATEVPA
jgi:F420-non-reducing hydrogenase iron-sulfur subunit